MRRFAILLSLLIMISLIAGARIDIIEPVSESIEEKGSVFVGTAGPGQTVYLIVDRATQAQDGRYVKMGWDTVISVRIPEGWEVEPSPLYETPMKLKVKIAPDARDGIYNLTLAAVDEGNYDGLGNATFYAIVNVSKDVFDIEISPTRVETGVGQPAVYYIKIRNVGAASDPFEISAEGLPAWRYRKVVLIHYRSEKVIPYEVVVNEKMSDKVFRIKVTSLSSPLISKETTVVVDSRNTLLTDWKATTHGVMIFPILEQPIYSIVGLFSNLI